MGIQGSLKFPVMFKVMFLLFNFISKIDITDKHKEVDLPALAKCTDPYSETDSPPFCLHLFN